MDSDLGQRPRPADVTSGPQHPVAQGPADLRPGPPRPAAALYCALGPTRRIQSWCPRRVWGRHGRRTPQLCPASPHPPPAVRPLHTSQSRCRSPLRMSAPLQVCEVPPSASARLCRSVCPPHRGRRSRRQRGQAARARQDVSQAREKQVHSPGCPRRAPRHGRLRLVRCVATHPPSREGRLSRRGQARGVGRTRRSPPTPPSLSREGGRRSGSRDRRQVSGTPEKRR